MSRSFLTTSMSSCVLDADTKRLQYRCGEIAVSFFFSFAALGASIGRSGERIESIDPPRPECCATRGDRKRSYSSIDCFCVGRGGLVVELIECELCALRKAWGIGGGMSGVLPLESVCDDLTIAALTDDSIPVSFGRNEGGTWSSSWVAMSATSGRDAMLEHAPEVDRKPALSLQARQGCLGSSISSP